MWASCIIAIMLSADAGNDSLTFLRFSTCFSLRGRIPGSLRAYLGNEGGVLGGVQSVPRFWTHPFLRAIK